MNFAIKENPHIVICYDVRVFAASLRRKKTTPPAYTDGVVER
jgi:hypothetical protein